MAARRIFETRFRRRIALLAVLATGIETRAFAETKSSPSDETPSDLSLVDLLDTEVVSASMSEQSLAEAAAVIDVITAEEIRARGYRTIGEALESVAGIDVTSDHYQSSLGVRGVSSGVRGWSRIVKVMIDGQPVSFRPSGENFLGVELVPLGVVDHIEVIRGPGSALYGANAFLGVINIITKSGYGLDGNSAKLRYEGGDNVEAAAGEATVSGQFGDFSVLLGATEEARRLHGYRLVPLPGRTHRYEDLASDMPMLPSASAYGRIGYDSERFGTFLLEGNFQRLFRASEFADWGPMTQGNRLELQNGYGKLTYRTSWQRRFDFEVSAALSSGAAGPNDRLSISPTARTHLERDLGYTGYDLASTLQYHLGRKSTVISGVDATMDVQTLLSHYTVTEGGARVLNPPAGTETGTRNFQNLGVFANTTLYPFGPRFLPALADLGVSAGGRLDAHNIYGDNGNARAGLVYDFNEKHYVKFLFGTSFRAPSATQLYSNYLVPSGAIGNPALRPERARTFEVALGTSPFAGLTLRADGFLTFIDDRVEIRKPPPASAGSNPYPSNSTPITSRGVEFQADYRSDTLAVFVNYSLQASSYRKEDTLALVPMTVNVQTDAYPTHIVKGGVTWSDVKRHFRIHLEGRFVGERLGNIDNNALLFPLESLTRRYSLPAYALFDLTISSLALEPWRGHETIVQVQAKNLFDTSYVMPGYSGFDIPGFSRSILLSLEQEL